MSCSILSCPRTTSARFRHIFRAGLANQCLNRVKGGQQLVPRRGVVSRSGIKLTSFRLQATSAHPCISDQASGTFQASRCCPKWVGSSGFVRRRCGMTRLKSEKQVGAGVPVSEAGHSAQHFRFSRPSRVLSSTLEALEKRGRGRGDCRNRQALQSTLGFLSRYFSLSAVSYSSSPRLCRWFPRTRSACQHVFTKKIVF